MFNEIQIVFLYKHRTFVHKMNRKITLFLFIS